MVNLRSCLLPKLIRPPSPWWPTLCYPTTTELTSKGTRVSTMVGAVDWAGIYRSMSFRSNVCQRRKTFIIAFGLLLVLGGWWSTTDGRESFSIFQQNFRLLIYSNTRFWNIINNTKVCWPKSWSSSSLSSAHSHCPCV